MKLTISNYNFDPVARQNLDKGYYVNLVGEDGTIVWKGRFHRSKKDCETEREGLLKLIKLWVNYENLN